MSLIGVGNWGNFKLWSIFLYLETRYGLQDGGCRADKMAHLKHSLSSFCTLIIAFFNFNFSGRATYDDPFKG
jgi:hypothetical protein